MINFQHVSKQYGQGPLAVTALSDIHLHIKKGAFSCLAGPSGAGKSTLLQLAGLLDQPTSGQVFINQQPTHCLNKTESARFRRQQIGFIFQRFNLIPVLTAFENVAYLLSLKKIPTTQQTEAVEAALVAVGLADQMHQVSKNLSGGQQQRVAVARALVGQPQLILADEPTGNLDSTTGTALIDLFEKINQNQATTFLFSSHDPQIIQRAQQVITLKDGKVSS